MRRASPRRISLGDIRVFVLFCVLSALAGCGPFRSGSKAVFDRLADDYLEATTAEQLTVPEDMSSESITDSLPIPEIEDHPLAKVFPRRPPRPVALVELEEEQAVRIQKLGDRQWMVVADAPELVWPVVIQFFTDNGIAIVEEDAEAGILVGEWISIADTGYPDVIRATIHRGHQLAEDFSGQDRVRIRLEQGIRFGSTEIHLRYDNDKTRINTAPPPGNDMDNPDGPEALSAAGAIGEANGVGLDGFQEPEPNSLPSTVGDGDVMEAAASNPLLSDPSMGHGADASDAGGDGDAVMPPGVPGSPPPANDNARTGDDSLVAGTDPSNPILLAEVGTPPPDAPGAALPPTPGQSAQAGAFAPAPSLTEANRDFETPSAMLDIEAALLNALGRYYSAEATGASVSLVGRSVATQPKALVERDDEGYPILHLNVDFDRAWATIRGSLERAAFEITDSDREQAEFHITVDPSAKENDSLKSVMPEGGKKAVAMRIRIRAEDDGHVINVLEPDGNPIAAELGERILATLREYAI